MFKWILKNNTTEETHILTRDPKGWEDLQLVHNRSDDYDGIFFDFSLEIGFFCKGAGKEFVDAAYNALGSEADVSLTLKYACQGRTFKTLFEGKLDFSSYKVQYRSKVLYTFLNVQQSGITQLIKNRESVDIDLLANTSLGGTSLIQYSPLVLNMHSRSIYMKSNWTGADHGCCTNDGTGAPKMAVYSVPKLELVKSDFDKSNAIPAGACGIELATGSNLLPNYFAGAPALVDIPTDSSIFTQTNDVTINYSFTGSVEIRQQLYVAIPDCEEPECNDANVPEPASVSPNSAYDLRLRIYFGDDTLPPQSACLNESDTSGLKYIELFAIPHQFAWPTATPSVNFSFSVTGSKTVPINRGSKIWIYWQFAANHASAMNYRFTYTYTTAEVSIESNTLSESTTCKALPIHEAWSRICEGITDQLFAFKSQIFGRTDSQGLSYPTNGEGSRTAITDGYRIRGFEQVLTGADVTEGQTKKGIVTNLKDMFNSCKAVFGVGLGVEKHNGVDVVRVEDKTYFYSDTRILKLDYVPNIEFEFLEDKAYSGVELGYKRWQPLSKNGLDETNTKATWEFPKIKSFDNKLSLLSEYVASSYAIESTRRKNVIFQTSDDSSYDDSIFLIALSLEAGEYEGSEYEPSEYFTNGLSIPERNENITVLSGLIDPDTAYNLRFNLFSNFDRLMNGFTNNLTKNQPQDIKYSYFEGNASMRFRYNNSTSKAGELNGEVVENVQNTTLPASRHRRGTPIIVPEQYTFSYPVPFTEYLNILSNPYGFISFSESDTNHKHGYIKTLAYNLKSKIAEFTLIRKY